MPRPHPKQSSVIEQARRFNVVACGRRWGKTALGMRLLVKRALRGYPVAWFAPVYKQLAPVWRDVTDILAPVTVRCNQQERRIELLGGGVVDMWSLDSADTVRGRAYSLVVIDEAAQVPNLEDAWQQVIRPTLTDYAGEAWFLSTPKGLNYFYVLWQLGQDPEQPEWQSWQFPTSTNPHMPPSEITAAEHDQPEQVFAQEYLAQFLEDGAGVFRRVLEACTSEPQSRQEGHTYVFGVDWAKHNDFTVISALDATTKQQVYLDRFNQIDYAVQVGRLKALYDRYRPRAIIAERNSIGEPLVEHLQRQRMPVIAWVATNATKAAVIEALALAFERGEIKILPDPVQKGELLAFTSERLPSGLIRYAAPEGMHDDTVMALALAWAGGGRVGQGMRAHDFEVTDD